MSDTIAIVFNSHYVGMHTFSSLNIDHSSLLLVHEQSNFNYFVL